MIGCFGLTEPDYGSNPGGMITRAEKTDNGYLLNRAKMWITNGTIADVSVVWTKLNGIVHGFLVERGTKGFIFIFLLTKIFVMAEPRVSNSFVLLSERPKKLRKFKQEMILKSTVVWIQVE